MEPTVTSTPSSMTVDQRDFHLRELEYLRALMTARIDLTLKLATYVMIGSAAIYAFLLATKPEGPQHLSQSVIRLGWFVPPLLTLIGGQLSWDAWRLNSAVLKYIRTLEHELGKPGLGWENTRGPRRLSWAWLAFWWALLVFNWAVAGVGFLASN